jgi:hypothetical protein
MHMMSSTPACEALLLMLRACPGAARVSHNSGRPSEENAGAGSTDANAAGGTAEAQLLPIHMLFKIEGSLSPEGRGALAELLISCHPQVRNCGCL